MRLKFKPEKTNTYISSCLEHYLRVLIFICTWNRISSGTFESKKNITEISGETETIPVAV